MGEVLLNGRPAADCELAAIERARRCERERDAEQLAGVTAPEVPPRPEHPGPVTDLMLEFA